jgi:uncharacterized damage-inducible protein DinB
MDDKISHEFICQSVRRINESTQKIVSCLNVMNEKYLWKSPNDHLNSVGNLVLHICGNITQYVISSMSGLVDNRDRDSEFSLRDGPSKQVLGTLLVDTIKQLVSIILQSSNEELLRERIVQGMNHTGIGVIVHVTEHISYHTGQIIFITKFYNNMDLGFYANVDLNLKNKI